MSALVGMGQGSPEWHAHRAQYRNASDAPAMMGCSPYESRAELLHRLHTGVRPEVDAATQRRFAEGHRAEALCRLVAEGILGEDLVPVVVVNGHLSASLDGRTLMGDTDWEHKLLSSALHACLPSEGVGDASVGQALPLRYRVQMAHQQYCSGASRTLFSASRWEGEELVEARHCWYERDEQLIAQVLAGWEQFDRDLAEYVPPDRQEPVTAGPQEHLPAVSVQVSGALSVVSNLAPFGVALREFIAKIPAKPSTDNDFATCEAACKRLKNAEDALEAAENNALASLADVNEMRRLVGEFRELARTTRLASEKLVKARKEQIREEEVMRGARALAEHVQRLNDRLGGRYMPPPPAGNFAAAIKGLKTVDSLRNAIDTELAKAKIEANEMADRAESNLKTINAAAMPVLFADVLVLVRKDPEAVQAIVSQRVSEHKAAEAKRLEVERERIRAEEQAKAQVEAARAQPHVAPPPVAQPPAPPPADRAEVAMLSTGVISARLGLGFTLPSDTIANVLDVPWRATFKASKMWYESDWPRIKSALIRHIQALP
jgi:predicted phage-related endonuclease